VILATREEFARMYQGLDTSEQILVSKSLENLEKALQPMGKPLRGGLANARSIRTGHNSRLRIV
jgi:mRNA-degrading endonuclease RelE of RelBE toxin-antitoxin system